ncbi:methyltransferase [Brevundimonas sp.]|uniref:class I SAM-dependent methyltransferase n=1 Tax=Brevundimonas sp. TaxID=1871086 RepID=UPI0028AC171C|nr:methyltransferase [Brevundimonas sp.]
MMQVRSRVRRLATKAKHLLYPSLPAPSPELARADEAVHEIWTTVFAPMQPTVFGADVLEVGCRDGRLLAALLAQNESARSATGVERIPYWSGESAGPAWNTSDAEGALELHGDLRTLEAFDPDSFDLILCRDFESVFGLDDLEVGLRRLYDLARPGGECILHVGCGSGDGVEAFGSGYGFLTPTSWTMLMMRAGFEIDARRVSWRDEVQHTRAANRLPFSSDDERLASSVTFRLLRPWETWELDRIWAAKNPM